MWCVLLAWEQPGVFPARTIVQMDLSSYRSLNILHTTGEVSEIMLAKTISDFRSHGQLRDEKVDFRIYNRTSERMGRRSAGFNSRSEE